MKTILTAILSLSLLPAAPLRAGVPLDASAREGLNAVQKQAAEAQRAMQQGSALEKNLAQAKYIRGILTRFLGPKVKASVAGLDMSYSPVHSDPIVLNLVETQVYDALRKDMPFLPTTKDGRAVIEPAADRGAQFDLLRAEFRESLERAARVLADEGKSPFDNADLKALAEWGNGVRIDAGDARLLGGNEYFSLKNTKAAVRFDAPPAGADRTIRR